MKSYTDLEQSKKLAEILSLESADCYWDYDEMQKFHRISWFEEGYNKDSQLRLNENNVCAWSLAALLDLLDDVVINDEGNEYYLTISKEEGMYYIHYHDRWEEVSDIETDCYYDLIDACYEMIIKLHELNIL
jgi:hypothetical protein